MIVITFRSDTLAITGVDGIIRFARHDALPILAPDLFYEESFPQFPLEGINFGHFLRDGEENEFLSYCRECSRHQEKLESVDLELLLKTRCVKFS